MKFTFKGKEDYSNQRTELINSAKELINDGKLDQAQAIQDTLSNYVASYKTDIEK